MKTHPKCATYDNFLHAEIHCLLGLSYEQTKGCDLYVCRIKRSGNRGISKPCPVCEAAIRRAGIRRVHYTLDSGEITTIDLRDV